MTANTTCRKPDCTVAQTGICLLNNDAATCPERQFLPTSSNESAPSLTIAPPLRSPSSNPKFPDSLTLTPEGLRAVTGKRYFRLVGILGAPAAGKTAVLVSLYLLLARNRLEGFGFAESLTMMAFDQISRGARRWNQGHPPEQMTSHTESPDQRTPGFLHLRLRSSGTEEIKDLLLPDLPGEWSDSLIDSSRVDRLQFLKASDVIWLMIDGRQLVGTKRQYVLHRANLILQRSAELLAPDIPPVLIVISHLDLGNPPDSSIASLTKEAARFGIRASVVSVASFSENDACKPGSGISELILQSLNDHPVTRAAFWPNTTQPREGRFVLRYRGQGERS